MAALLAYEADYDTLVLSPGAAPIRPNIEGIDSHNVFTVRNVVDIERLNSFVKQNEKQDIAVIGGGFIGAEVAENLQLAGHHVSLIEFADQVMAPYDYDMAQIIHKEMTDQGVDLILNDGLEKIGAGFVDQCGVSLPVNGDKFQNDKSEVMLNSYYK